MTNSLDSLTVQRLAYVRYLYREGIEQSRQPPPLRSRSITSFHDAVENFVGLVAQHLGIELTRGTEFLGCWGLIKPKFELPKKEPMRRLNDARVALKHNGTFPSEHQIEQARETLADFFTSVTPKVFGADFDSIDMVDLVTQPETKRLLREAQTHADVGDYIHAMAGLSLAFQALRVHYSGAGSSFGWEQTPFSFGPRLDWADEPRVDQSLTRNRRIKKLSEIAETTQEAMQVMSLGIDFPSFARFKSLAPRVHGYLDGTQRYTLGKWDESLTQEDYAWARQFVIESALQAARADGIQDVLDAQMKANWDARNTGSQFPERAWTGPVQPDEADSLA